MEEIKNSYLKLIKTKLISSPLLFMGINIIGGMNPYLSVFCGFFLILIVVEGVNKKSYTLLSMMPIKTKNIITFLYISLYLVVGVSGVISSIIFSLTLGTSFGVSFTVASLMVVMVNLLIPENFSKGMSTSISGWFMLMVTLYTLISFGVVIGIETTNLQNIIGDNILLTILIGSGCCAITLKSSYERSVSKIYG